MKLFFFSDRQITVAHRRGYLELSSNKAWRIVRSGAPRGGRAVDHYASPRENSIHQSSCQTKSLDKEGEKSTNEKVGIAEEDKVGQEGRPSGTVYVRCEREKNLLFGEKRIKGLEFL